MRKSHIASIWAFTLIELSIVLVIIGLIIGAVFVGRDLIHAAEIRSTIQQYEQFKAAVNTFTAKYGGIPGDITTTEATAFGFLPTTRNCNAQGVVHGDGLLESGSVGGPGGTSAFFNTEVVLFWQDLSSAGLIAGGFNSITSDSEVFGATAGQVSLYIPPAKISGIYWAAASNVTNTYKVPVNNYYYLGGMTGITNVVGDYSTPNYATSLTPTQAYDIDVKLDDGLPFSGSVLASNDTNWGLDAPAMDATTTTYRANGTCGVTNAAGQWLYNTVVDTPECMLNLRF